MFSGRTRGYEPRLDAAPLATARPGTCPRRDPETAAMPWEAVSDESEGSSDTDSGNGVMSWVYPMLILSAGIPMRAGTGRLGRSGSRQRPNSKKGQFASKRAGVEGPQAESACASAVDAEYTEVVTESTSEPPHNKVAVCVHVEKTVKTPSAMRSQMSQLRSPTPLFLLPAS